MGTFLAAQWLGLLCFHCPVQSLVRELGSHRLCSEAKQTKKQSTVYRLYALLINILAFSC